MPNMFSLIKLTLFLGTALALPAAPTATDCTMTQAQTSGAHPSGIKLTPEMLLRIVPKAASCAGAPIASECRTAEQAAPHIIESFNKYAITHPEVQAALISLMAYETGDFKYGVNHYPAPGVPGQGTRNMQSPKFNFMYAKSLGLGAAVTASPQILMQSLTQDKYSWGSAAWFVTSQCPYKIRQDMWTGGQAAWEKYLKDCVGTTVNDQRKAYWQAATKELTGKAPA